MAPDPFPSDLSRNDDTLAAMFKDGRWDKAYDSYLGKFEGLPSAKQARESLPATN